MAVLLLAATSRVPWYVAGGALAAWAVVLSAIGLTHPPFPYGLRGQRAVAGLSLLLAVIAIAMAIVTA